MKKTRDLALSAVMASSLIWGMGAFASPAQATPLWPKLSSPQSQPVSPQTGNVIKAQSANQTYQIGQLEEQIRSLNGRIEELGFQLLQMEERIRQMQEDNEFRFQQLEGGATNMGDRSDAGPAVTEQPMDHATGENLPGVENSTTASTNPVAGQGAGEPPRTLGTITFDANGNPVDSGQGNSATGNETAALDNPNDLYQAGYSHMLAGDYQLAEQIFLDFVQLHNSDPQMPDAMFWLGEAQFSQGRYKEAAQTFLDAHKRYPQAAKGADTMLKLGMSLAALNKNEPACSTYRQLVSNYPAASQAVRNKVKQEQQQARC